MFKNDEALVAEEMRRTTEAAAVSEDTMFEEQASDDGPQLFFYYYFLKKCVLQRFFYFWQNIVCFSFITVHTRYITIMCLQKETGKENIHESPKCIKLNRCKNKLSEKIKKTQ